MTNPELAKVVMMSIDSPNELMRCHARQVFQMELHKRGNPAKLLLVEGTTGGGIMLTRRTNRYLVQMM